MRKERQSLTTEATQTWLYPLNLALDFASIVLIAAGDTAVPGLLSRALCINSANDLKKVSQSSPIKLLYMASRSSPEILRTNGSIDNIICRTAFM
jgi:hypothetical protein